MKDASEILARAVELHTQGEYMEAEVIYDLALQLFPDDPRSYYLLGTLYSEIEKDGVALALLLRSMDMNPTTECANNLGIVLRRVGHEDAALTAYEAALEMEPDNIEAMSNMSGYYVNQGNPDKGIEWADKTLERDPEKWEAMSHKGLCLLEKGDYENGFDVYRSRTNLRTWHQRNYAPMWDGSRVKKLVIHGEQGIGDEILFMSNYWDKIKDWADEIIIECTPRIVQLFERTFKVRCYGTEEEVPDKDIDAQVPMGHLPFFLGEPGRMTELVPDPERVGFYRAKLEEMGDGPYIGLSWKGGLKSTHQHLRNTSIEDWERFLLGTPISVQYGLAGKSAEHLGIPHWQDAIDDLDELAALIKACDLIVSVCNTTIHMAGAMNVPTYILVPSKPAWRYGMTGEKMHWYQSPKMFRQTEGWEPVFKDVRKAIQEFIRTRKVAA
jgi:tetratricopeptide (TPR) repeat protein